MLAAPGRNVFSLLAPPPIASTHTNAILEITKRVPGITRTLLLYRFIQLAGLPLTALYFIARLVTQREYWSHFGERLGLLSRSFTRTKPGSIWLHAVSLGEIASALPLIEHLRRQHPLVPIYLSTATIAGRRAAERDLDALVNGLFYSPLDYVSCVRRVLRTIRPALLIVLETEIWPNLYVETTRTGARLAILNGRISDRAWPQYRRWRRLFAPILQLPDTISVQSGKDYDRYLQLGVPASKLRVEGNLKYDACAVRPPLSLEIFGAEQVWIAASTVGPNERGSLTRHAVDEDDILIRAFQALAVEFPHLLLILAPRQPARFPVVAQKLERSGLPFIRRTSRATSLQLPGVVLLDSVGELSRLYSYASVVFVGGSLAPRGGHNIIEPAAAGAPIVVGPNMQNFEAIMADFVQANAIAQIESDQELLPAVRRLLVNRDAARDLGRRARELTEQQRGISERLANSMYPLFSSATLARPHSFAGRMFLGALSFVWREAGIVKRRHAEKYADAQPPLDVPVISIGGITVGGSGKTPFTIYLARRLRERGFQPAILTRGYGRQSAAKSLVFVPGSKAPATMTGDEAQMLLKRGQAPIGIGGNRYETARVLLTHLPETDILLLDDGFQHARLK
ncbi:MAG: tetraacyldisaccharide 4'-kinase, partial [Acidobacteriaceae bacterium]|nr:tetraacyldisaccharide 4'-kinase [Acidobacteriaceae bacterium]